MGWSAWAAFQSLLPIITGGYADRFGYKRTLVFSLALMMAGYLMIALLRGVVDADLDPAPDDDVRHGHGLGDRDAGARVALQVAHLLLAGEAE